jgi:hypothetical protein
MPPSLNGAKLLRQNDSLLKLWSIHTIGNTVTLCHNAACAPCAQYVEHLLLHMGMFGLPLEQVQEVASKAWPCLIETTQEEATRPLTRRLADLQHYMQDEQEWHTDLKNALEDLRVRHEDLKELCKAQAQALRTKERECNSWAAKVHCLDNIISNLEALGP